MSKTLACCLVQEQLCCFVVNAAYPPTEEVPLTCALLGLACYPKCGFCQLLSHYYPPDEYPLLAPKKDYCPCNSCCFGPLCHGTFYFKIPTTLCAHSGYCCAKFYEDAALPCVEEIPFACFLWPICGLMLFPKIACCPKASPYFPDSMFKEPLVEGAVVGEPKTA